MKSSRNSLIKLLCSAYCISLMLLSAHAAAQVNPLRFQRPGDSQQASEVQQKFRSPSQVNDQQAPEPPRVATKLPAKKQPVSKTPAKKPQGKKATSPRPEVVQAAAELQQPERAIQPIPELADESEEIHFGSPSEGWDVPTQFDGYEGGCPCGQGPCSCDPGCGICDPGCGICDPGCGVCDPGCGVCDPGCGCPQPSCGSRVGIPGPEFWCFQVCLPRIKDVSFWGGVQGFRGPRDFVAGAAPTSRSDSNFGFHEGVNISGRAPLVSRLFPQLSYQLGFQSFQSRLSGTTYSDDDRGQQFITAGLYRRVCSGVQFGVVYDYMKDDLDEAIGLSQVRYEISLKSPKGREVGYWGTSSTDDAMSDGVNWATVNQHAAFFRWNLYDGYQARVWAGGTGNSEGLLGADFYAPLNDRWSVQTGFNYLIPEQDPGPAAVRHESWNLGINLVWHIGCSAKKGANSPFRPLFGVADNGWMFVDQK
ncbi:DUF6666 family protein [Bythopirellula goksoeyrii]|uniref:Carbohydrate-selective porin, OprB family n=1 Tax=Bythopirellula goksoeyrii TaxID=1400387 RepID=A0A5B9QEN8_9BACT|nr:DUF6666 family protein [Bythopirellula goksoeyrii]QEG35376.1 hypothetical protein Pr1d_26740 [Bythopirellula goksoeyrii]